MLINDFYDFNYLEINILNNTLDSNIDNSNNIIDINWDENNFNNTLTKFINEKRYKPFEKKLIITKHNDLYLVHNINDNKFYVNKTKSNISNLRTVLTLNSFGKKIKTNVSSNILENNLNWTNISNTRGWDEISDIYGVKAIPQNFLINPEGIIIKKNIDVKELKLFVDSIQLN